MIQNVTNFFFISRKIHRLSTIHPLYTIYLLQEQNLLKE